MSAAYTPLGRPDGSELSLGSSLTSCDVWRIDLDSESSDAQLAAVLSSEERRRASRFRSDLDGKRFATARLALRCVLGRYLRAAPADLFIEEDDFGRPRLASQSPWAGALDFNLSHSAGVAAIAVSSRSAVGIDVEVVRTVPEACDLAQRFFAPAECRELALKSASELDRAFLTCWTRKEAVLKCVGVGLRFNPAHLDVGLDEQDRVIRICAGGPEVLLNVTSMALGPDIIVSIARDREVPISTVFSPEQELRLRAESIAG